ncbi:LCR-like protein, partial [Trifolium medium]|nr:LCR-like protein [Trifolium medium]
ITINGLGQHISPIEYRTILKYRLVIPLFSINEVYLVCHKACMRARVYEKKEAPVNFLTDPQPTGGKIYIEARRCSSVRAVLKAASSKLVKHEKAFPPIRSGDYLNERFKLTYDSEKDLKCSI